MNMTEQLLQDEVQRLTTRLRETEDKCALVSEWELSARTLVEELRSKLTFQRVETALAAAARDAAEKVLQEAATLLGIPLDQRYQIGAKYGPIAELQENYTEARQKLEESKAQTRAALRENAALIADIDELIAKVPTDSPSGEGDRLLLNAYGRQCYYAGRKSALREVHAIATEDNNLSALGALIEIVKIADREPKE